MSVVDRTKLNALVANLDAGKFADPELLQAVEEEVYTQLDIRPDNTEVVGKSNTTAFTPTQPYQPATKQYVDDQIVSQTITKTNTTAFTPSANYHPTTKKYTDDAINDAITGVIGTPIIQTGTSFPVTPTEGQSFFRSDERRFYVYSASVWNPSNDVGSQIYAYKNMGGF